MKLATWSVPVFVLAALAWLAGPVAAQGQVFSVGPFGGGSDFFNLQTAVDTVPDGSVLLIEGGVYGSVTIGGSRSMSLVNESQGAANVILQGPLIIRDSLPGTRYLVSGLCAQGQTDSNSIGMGYGLRIRDNQGDVVIQDCTFEGADGDPFGWNANLFSWEITGHPGGWDAAWIAGNTGRVSITGCSFVGGDGTHMGTFGVVATHDGCGCTVGEPGGDGVRVIDSLVAFHDVVATGGRGSLADYVGGAGGMGIRFEGGTGQLSGVSLEGGRGGFAEDTAVPAVGGPGGDGLHVTAGGLVRSQSLAATGGDEGNSYWDPGIPGQPVGGAGTHVAHASTARQLSATVPVAAGEVASVTISGQPGDIVILLLSTGTGWGYVPDFQGQLLVSVPALDIALGTLPPSGELTLGGTVPSLAPFESATVYLQAIAGTVGDAALTGAVGLVTYEP